MSIHLPSGAGSAYFLPRQADPAPILQASA
uniref:Uncharacterized protein n=1 Tax=Siphoviridae sp. ctTnV63 TaxID=2825523 RepID=A0A8S5NUX6_9CAUD|nr:MAG TPA: hypothetical protein [Siphoviridae sp. ctTnV63]